MSDTTGTIMCNRCKDWPGSEGENVDGIEDKNDKLFDTCSSPMFAELLLTMVDELPDDIVSWSAGLDSFIIKQVCEERRILLLRRWGVGSVHRSNIPIRS